jgi:D-glycero-D-manno-heptose 1,7-bisphosphate phosphatase
LRAGRELGIDLARSWMVGDRAGDIEAGSRAGCRTILVLTGEGSETLREISAGAKARPDHVFGSLLEAVRFVISPDSRGRDG